jgi:hypothetical protein
MAWRRQSITKKMAMAVKNDENGNQARIERHRAHAHRKTTRLRACNARAASPGALRAQRARSASRKHARAQQQRSRRKARVSPALSWRACCITRKRTAQNINAQRGKSVSSGATAR